MENNRIGVTGCKGRLGKYLLNHYYNFIPLECDVTRPDEVENCIRSAEVGKIIHLAAKSDVEFCERRENARVVSDVNLRGTFNVCEAAESMGIGVLLLSSDHIFSGKGGKDREASTPAPTNYYGWSKYAAEGLQTIYPDTLKIVRTSYLFDGDRLSDHIYAIKNKIPQTYPVFIMRSFQYFPHFAENLVQYISRWEDMPRILHLSGSQTVSWWEFMVELAKRVHSPIEARRLIVPRYEDDSAYVPRPLYGGLNVGFSKRLGFAQYSYLDGIQEMIKELG